ncbi:MAG: radical SAM protein [Candidatus Pacearchaeota archaeon]
MKILLIVPKYNFSNKINYEYAFPIGLAYIAAVVKKYYGSNLKSLNLNHLDGKTEYLVHNKLNEEKYDVILTGHLGIGYAAIEKIVKAVKKHKTKPKIIIGGSLVTSEPELMLTSLKPDYIVIGEGEETIIELLKTIEKNEDPLKVNGIGFLKDNEPILTKPRELITNIDEIPFPDFEELEYTKFLENLSNSANYHELDYPRNYCILLSRGCPFQCTFCYHSIGSKYRTRSLDNIFKEIEEAIKKFDINSLIIYDDMFSVNKKRLFEFCKRIKELSLKYKRKIVWSCQLSVIDVDREMLLTLKDSGCNIVSFGFESYSPIVLKSMKKPITPEAIANAVKLTREVKIGIQANFIFGDTAETKETAAETLNFWKNYCEGQVQLGFIQPYPGSEIYKRCLEKGIIKDKLDFIKNNISHTNWFNMTEKMSDKEILDLKKEILDSRWKYQKYIIPKKIKKTSEKKYDIEVECPYCKETIIYKNTFLNSAFHFVMYVSCRNCHMRFYISSKVYRFEMKYYQKLDFFRRKYLYIRDNLLKKRI